MEPLSERLIKKGFTRFSIAFIHSHSGKKLLTYFISIPEKHHFFVLFNLLLKQALGLLMRIFLKEKLIFLLFSPGK